GEARYHHSCQRPGEEGSSITMRDRRRFQRENRTGSMRDDRYRGNPRGTPQRPRDGGSRASAAGRSRHGEQLGIGGFELFCAYHLGITADDRSAFQNVHEVARRFATNAGMIRQLLEEYEMDPDRVVNSSFDLAAAQVDIMLAPEGVSKVELARSLYQEFLA